MSRGLSLTFILQLCAFLQWGHGQTVPPEAAEFFNNIETSVQLIATSALTNYRNRQELWKSCNTDTSCSIYSCKPLRLYANNSQCVGVPGDRGNACQGTTSTSGNNSAGCWNATLSTHSYIRLPPSADESKLTCDTEMAICAQRDLDQQVFEKLYANDSGPFNRIAWSQFAASNGVFRIYPGLEQDPDECAERTYDPRTRPWYKAVTSVSKQVIFLLDTGGSMANLLSLSEGNQVQIFTAAQRIAQDFLHTLTAGDVVSVYSFDSSQATMIGEKVNIGLNETLNEEILEPLKEAINGISVSLTAAQANLTAALETVLFNGGFESSPAKVKSLKIILVITGGDLVEGPAITIPTHIIEAVTTDEVRTFIYRLSDSSNGADVSKLADLKSAACSLGGSYDQIPQENILQDPLSALGSFYTYVANLRFSLEDGQKPLWVPSYSTFSGVGEVMTVVYPVFDDIFLVGVAAIDLFTRKVEDKWPGALDIRKESAANIEHNQGTPLNCNVSLIPETSVCSDDQDTSFERGLCVDSSFVLASTAEAYAARTCCDSGCGLSVVPSPSSTSDDGGKDSKAGVIGGASAAGVLLLLFLLLLCYWKTRIQGLWKGYMTRTPETSSLSSPVNGGSSTPPAAVTRANGSNINGHHSASGHQQASDTSSREPHPSTSSPVSPPRAESRPLFRGGYDIAL